MNQSNVLIPDATPDEAMVVDRFIEASRDLVPSVQISLAKRIVNADSNQVVCLAAHTSVPLHPSDASSVSDLALKLSDGTNVRLSLKFFNDALPSAGGEYIPLTRNLYDPNRYEVKNRSRFPAILSLTLMIAGLASYRYFTVAESSRIPQTVKPISATATPHQTVALAHAVVTASAGATATQHAQIPSSDLIGKNSRVHSNRATSKEPRQKLTASRQHHETERTAFLTKSPPSMFVPPPPPMALPLTANGSAGAISSMSNIDFGGYTLVPNTKPLSMPAGKTNSTNKNDNLAQVAHSAKFTGDQQINQAFKNSPDKSGDRAPAAMRPAIMEQVPDAVQSSANPSVEPKASTYSEQRIDPLGGLAPVYSSVKGAPQPGNNETAAASHVPLERISPYQNSSSDSR